jgi:hypothetical protein
MGRWSDLVILALAWTPGFALLLLPLRWLSRRALSFEEL